MKYTALLLFAIPLLLSSCRVNYGVGFELECPVIEKAIDDEVNSNY